MVVSDDIQYLLILSTGETFPLPKPNSYDPSRNCYVFRCVDGRTLSNYIREHSHTKDRDRPVSLEESLPSNVITILPTHNGKGHPLDIIIIPEKMIKRYGQEEQHIPTV